MSENKIDCVFNYLNNDDFRYHMEDGTPYKELSVEERDILSAYIIQLQQENQQLKRNCNIGNENLNFYRNEYKKLEEENQQLKMIIEEYERLNKENGRGFKITSVKQYDIDELLKYKSNWNKLKDFLEIRLHKNCNLSFYGVVQIREELEKVINKMQELEGNDSK